ncbi:GNAT family N-acetyltransferase [Galactobacter valiniphilus]|uniref:GNAT family N-acetyltransferase n=1 Tax=Galactobacter valiniphilus TaxID=2676122 RepID=A0A399J916_9MICC|nr:GNAT family N-acetyltransferase [Galactobacter valiniphilus]RII42091.1 GNAT family N-acetyltransferase [Galactobacter valiniphilus]
MISSLTLPVTLASRAGTLRLEAAVPGDLDALMALLADDAVSASRGDVAAEGDRERYAAALAAIQADPSNVLLLARDGGGVAVATMQLTVIPGMARRGSTRLLVEAVRVSSERRSAGIGGEMMRWVMGPAALACGASLVQLTSDAARVDAHRFYERLGFVGSHVGFKYHVPGGAA